MSKRIDTEDKMNGAGSFSQDVKIRDRFWSRTRETVRREGIPYQWKALNDQIADAEPSYCMRNFRIAAGKEQGEHAGYVFQDSDAAKWIEGAAYTLRWHPDPELEATIDGAIREIVEAQQPDGYLDTYYTIKGLHKRFTNLKDHHELYCAGHMLEAAVAYYRVTGKRELLDAMIRFVDCIDGAIGPEEGKIRGYPGHPVLEMALMRLYDITHEEKHLRLARYFVDQRGQQPLFFEEDNRKNHNDFHWKDSPFQYQYYQAGKPVREQQEAEGHAVRAMYLYSGMADVARVTGDESLRAACRRLWESTVYRRMYVTGNIGSSEYGEAFTFDYDLPNDTIYGETCASIGLVFFARRMLELDAKGEYADVMERALYNGILSGMQLDGKKFFYVNPLEVVPEACRRDAHKRHVEFERQRWFGCACCPPNVIRLISSLEEYICSVKDDTIYLHLYVGGSADVQVNGHKVHLEIETRYPWDSKVTIRVHADTQEKVILKLRIPGWCKEYTVSMDGKRVEGQAEDGYFAVCPDADTVISMDIKMPVTILRANPRISEDTDKVAISRGPIIYCLEEEDNGKALHMLRLCGAAPGAFSAEWKEDKLGGIVELNVEGIRESDTGWENVLYGDRPIESQKAQLTFIPYYSWANRHPGEMRVFVRR